MTNDTLSPLLQNRTLKTEFKIRNLDPYELIDPEPENLDLENRQLENLLDWVFKYQECGRSRGKMEAGGFLYPPMSFDIDPDSDWLRFELLPCRNPLDCGVACSVTNAINLNTQAGGVILTMCRKPRECDEAGEANVIFLHATSRRLVPQVVP